MYRVVVISPPGYQHAGAFAEMAETLVFAFRALGHSAQAAVNIFSPDAMNIVLGGHLLAEDAVGDLPANSIFYNLEQVEDDLFRWAPVLSTLYERFKVWDYSPRNLERLKSRGLAGNSALVPIGTVSEMTRIKPAEKQDIDVLFYGAATERRKKVLKAVEKTGVKLTAIFGAYGKERDDLIARSKVVLNIHKHDAQVFEIVRVSYLLANSKAVVSEGSATTEIDDDIKDAVALTPLDNLAAECKRLVKDTKARRILEAQGHLIMAARSQADYLRSVL